MRMGVTTKYYVYAHFNNLSIFPFYVGFSRNRTGRYNRAKDRTKRSAAWKEIYNKSIESFSFEIIYESDDRIKALDFEYDYIEKFMIKSEKGLLVNKSKGIKNGKCVHSESTIDKIRKSNTGRKLSEDTKRKISESLKKSRVKRGFQVYQYDINGNYIGSHDNIYKAERSLGLKASALSKYVVNKNGYSNGFLWRKEFKGFNISVEKQIIINRRVLCIDIDTQMVDMFSSANEASMCLFGDGGGNSYIKDCCIGERSVYKNYKFSYAN